MALNKETLKQGIIALQNEMKTKTEADEAYFAEQLASLIEAFVKSGTVTVQAGIALQAGSFTGITTATGTGTIS